MEVGADGPAKDEVAGVEDDEDGELGRGAAR